jgi:hypothetical protein
MLIERYPHHTITSSPLLLTYGSGHTYKFTEEYGEYEAFLTSN